VLQILNPLEVAHLAHMNRLFTALTAGLLTMAAVSAQTMISGYPATQAVSPRMSDLHGATNATGPTVIHHPFAPSHDPHQADAAAQTSLGPLINASGGTSFDGMNVSNGGYIPSDNNIAVGPNHVVEVVNAAYAVYSKTGVTLLTPRSLGGLWSTLSGSSCKNNSGDTVVQYDRAADRWMITQLGSLGSPYSECIAVSTTNDPTGAYHLYSYDFGNNLNDYPKFGVWPTATNSAYLATYNLFSGGGPFVGAEICAYDRAAMLAGAAAGYVCFTGISGASFLPIDLDGSVTPADGTSGSFMDLFGSSLGVYKLSPNFATSPPTAALSTFSTIPVAGYSQASSSPQPGTAQMLDSLSDRAMYRLAYRRFSDHDSVVLNHSVMMGSGNSGVRWYELRSTTGTYSLYQQGTYAPDSSYRWMGSAAMDQAGDIAIGYSVSDSTVTFPSVRYTGRVPGDTLGTMESEGVIINGKGSQTGYTRWGDYSSLRIDPADDCTFWYVNEYYPATSSAGWYTRIGSFKFNNCTINADFSLSASPSSARAQAGSPAVATISVTALNGYSGTVNLAVTPTCPAVLTCTLGSGSVAAGGNTTLTVATTSSTPAGNYIVTVTGTDSVNSSLTHTTTFTVTVPDFSLSATPGSASIAPGQSPTSQIGASTSNGYSGTINLAVLSGCPANATCSLNPASIQVGATSTLTVATTASTPNGTYSVVVKGTDSANLSLTHTTTFTVTVTTADFGMSASPSSFSIPQGGTGTSTIGVSSIGGFASSVGVAVTACPLSLTCSLSRSSVPPGQSSVLTVKASANAPFATYPVTVTGTSGSLTHSVTVSVTVKHGKK
jgi:hypothetical protein